MSRVCEVTGKGPAAGNRVSHANNRRRRRFLPNLHTQRFWLETEKRWVSLRVSTNGLRTIEKKGIDEIVAELRAQGDEDLEGATMREKDQTVVLGRHRPLLRDHQEQAPASGQVGSAQVRPGRAQARRLQRNQDQVSRSPAPHARGSMLRK